MRFGKVALWRPVKSDVRLRYEAERLASFAGLELLRQHFGKLGLGEQNSPLCGSVAMVLLVLTLIICGGRRIRHVEYLGSDPLELRVAALPERAHCGPLVERF